MGIRRLEEEKKILVREMDHHWKSLSKYDDILKELSGLFSSEIFKSMYLSNAYKTLTVSEGSKAD